ncbi:MAG: hypothetical protein FJ191_03280 [Gammaproteobacteria bacterium]|nr:hypothetical protein [Gammaproteobacteria bacterium]
MTKWNRLLAVLDETLEFANRKSSTVKKIKQGYDDQTNEHVIWLEYRVRLENDLPVKPPQPNQRELAYLRRVAADVAAARGSQKR